MNINLLNRRLRNARIPATVTNNHQEVGLLFSIINNRESNSFSINIDPALEDIKLSVSSEHRQAVITIDEPTRIVEVTEKTRIFVDRCSPFYDKKGPIPVTDTIFQNWLNDRLETYELGLIVPLTDGSTVETLETVLDPEEDIAALRKKFKDLCESEYSGGITFSVKCRARLPKMKATLLFGIDEDHTFVCALPKVAFSVKEAHRVLTPKEVTKDSVRQGEFFFIPATDEEIYKISDELRRKPITVDRESPLTDNDGNDKDHIADMVITTTDGIEYASGIVRQESGRHSDLILYGWHRVVPNNEIPVSDDMSDQWD